MENVTASRALKIKKYCDHSKRAVEHYIASFACYVDNTLLFQLDYLAKANMCKACVIVDHTNTPVLEMRPVKGIGREKISFIQQEKFVVKKIGDALVDAQGNNVALIVDPSSLGKALLRNALNGDADNFIISSPDKKSTLANIRSIHSQSDTSWPLRIATRLAHAIKRPMNNFIYKIENIDDRFTPELLFGLSVLLMQQHNTV
ncbi:hypothetical protein TDB9533_03386 [Thalassocella blandensis]|nr:hypothetical protein TDB9533_03386 [Thalassocella blandensis]